MNIGKSNLAAALLDASLRARPPFGDGYDAVREDRAIAKRERIARRNLRLAAARGIGRKP